MATVPDRILGFVLGLSPLIAVAWLSRGSRMAIGSVESWTVTDDGRAERINRDKGGGAPVRSDLLSAPSKMNAPSFSIPAVHTCPAVRCSIEKAIKGKPLPESDEGLRELLKDIARVVPPKCIGCYAMVEPEEAKAADLRGKRTAMGGQYATPESMRAHKRRMNWFRAAPEEKIVETLVKAIGEAGQTYDETCKHKLVRNPNTGVRKPGIVGCKKKASARPKYVRLHDSGDFENPRAVRIWQQVIERMPDVNFWAPTTAQVDPGMIAPLQELNRLPNVVVRPSALLLDEPGPEIPGLSAGSAVLDWKPKVLKKQICTPLKKKGVPNPNAGKPLCTKTVHVLNGEPDLKRGVHAEWRENAGIHKYRFIGGKLHYICPGDCRQCRYCWQKRTKYPVAYLRHGTFTGKEEDREKRLKAMLFTVFPQFPDIGP